MWVEYNQNTDLIIKDKEDNWSSYDVSVTRDGTTSIVKITITFDKPMDTSHVILKAWDDKRNSMNIEFNNALHIVQAKPILPTVDVSEQIPKEDNSITITNTETGTVKTIPEEELVITTPFTMPPVMDAVNKWTGYSSESLTDKEFLNSIGVDGNNVPDWIKKNTAKWFRAGDITEEEFVPIFKHL